MGSGRRLAKVLCRGLLLLCSLNMTHIGAQKTGVATGEAPTPTCRRKEEGTLWNEGARGVREFEVREMCKGPARGRTA